MSVNGRTTCWDECRPSGAEAFLIEKLNSATTDDCTVYQPLSDCALELLRESNTCQGRQLNNGERHQLGACDEAVDGWKPALVYNTVNDGDDGWRKPLEEMRNSNKCALSPRCDNSNLLPREGSHSSPKHPRRYEIDGLSFGIDCCITRPC